MAPRRSRLISTRSSPESTLVGALWPLELIHRPSSRPPSPINFLATDDHVVVIKPGYVAYIYKMDKVLFHLEYREEVPLVAPIISSASSERDLDKKEGGGEGRGTIVSQLLMAAVLMTNGRPIPSRRKNATNILIASRYDNSPLFHRFPRPPGDPRYSEIAARSERRVSDRGVYTCRLAGWLRAPEIPVLSLSLIRIGKTARFLRERSPGLTFNRFQRDSNVPTV